MTRADVARRVVLAASSRTLLIMLGLFASTVVVLAAEPEGAISRDQLLPLPPPVYERQEPAVREQLNRLYGEVDRLLADPGSSDAALGRAFGEVGRMAFLYDLESATTASLENAKLLQPEDPRWPYLLAAHFTFEGELELAEKNLRRTLELRPGDPPSLLRMGNVLFDLGRADEAEGFYQQVVDLPGLRAAALAGLGRIAQRRREHERAVELIREALEIQPEADSLYHVLGLSLRSLGDMDGAREALAKNRHARLKFSDPVLEGLSQDNVSMQAQMQTAGDAMRRGDYQTAIDHYLTFIDRGGSDPLAFHNLGIALIATDRWQQGVDALRRSLEIDPDYRGGHFSLGSALAEQGLIEEALPHYEMAHELDPQERVIHADWAVLLAKSGDHERALEELSELLAEDPTNDYARLKYGTVLASAGRTEEALAELAPIADSGGLPRAGRAEAHQHLALIAQEKGQAEAVDRHLRSAVELNPRSAAAQRAYGEHLARTGSFSDAAEAFARAVEVKPDDLRLHFSRAMALLLGEQDRRALEALEGSLEVHADDPTLRHLLARVLASSSDEAVRDGARGLRIAEELLNDQLTFDHAETTAMALAELGRFGDAVALQERVVAQAERSGRDREAEHRKRLERLESYRRGEPVRSPWLG